MSDQNKNEYIEPQPLDAIYTAPKDYDDLAKRISERVQANKDGEDLDITKIRQVLTALSDEAYENSRILRLWHAISHNTIFDILFDNGRRRFSEFLTKVEKDDQ